MSYRSELDKAETVEELQSVYEKEMQRRYNKYKKQDLDDPFGQCICDDARVFFKAEHRAVQLFGEREYDTWIKSKY